MTKVTMPEPVAWVRRHPDGTLAAEFLEDAVISPTRKSTVNQEDTGVLMDATDRTYTAEQQEILQLLRDAANAAKQLHAAMDAISFELSQEYASKIAAPVAQEPVRRWPFVESPGAFTERLRMAHAEFGDLLAAVRCVLIENPPTLAPVAAQAQPQQSENQEALADTQRAIIEAAERRGYERAIAECGQDRKDAERYRLLRRGKHWGIINAAGDPLRTDVLDAAIDAARAQQEGQS